MKDLKLFMRYTRQHRDEIRFRSQYPTSVNSVSLPTTVYSVPPYSTKGRSPKAIHPVLVAIGGLLP
jgi:hypothetical protein